MDRMMYKEMLEELRKTYSMNSLADALNISRVYLYSVLADPRNASQTLLDRIEAIYQDPSVIRSPRTDKEQMQEEIQILKEEIEKLKAAHQEEVHSLQMTVKNLNLLIEQLLKK